MTGNGSASDTNDDFPLTRNTGIPRAPVGEVMTVLGGNHVNMRLTRASRIVAYRRCGRSVPVRSAIHDLKRPRQACSVPWPSEEAKRSIDRQCLTMPTLRVGVKADRAEMHPFAVRWRQAVFTQFQCRKQQPPETHLCINNHSHPLLARRATRKSVLLATAATVPATRPGNVSNTSSGAGKRAPITIPAPLPSNMASL